MSSDNFVTMPTHLAGDLACVFSIYGLGKASDFGREKGWQPFGFGRGRQKPPATVPTPASPAVPEIPPAQDVPTQNDDEPESGMAKKLKPFALACEKAGEFGLPEIVDSTGSSYRTVRHYIDMMMEIGWVERLERGRYRWKGRGAGA